MVSKTPQVVAKAFEDILERAGTAPRSPTSDQGPEFSGAFAEMLKAKGIASSQKRKEDISAIVTVGTAIGNLKKTLARGTRKVGTNDWASRLGKVTRGQNNNPIGEYLESETPADVSTKTHVFFLCCRRRMQSVQPLTRSESRREIVRLREQANLDQWKIGVGTFTRGFRLRLGEVKQVKEFKAQKLWTREAKIT